MGIGFDEMGFGFGAGFVFEVDVVAYFFALGKVWNYGFPLYEGVVVVGFKLNGKNIGYALFGFAIGRVFYSTCAFDSFDLDYVRRRVVVINDVVNIIFDLLGF